MVNGDLIYDVGMHKGEDSRFYLSRGYRVVGIEANPLLATEIRETFAREIRNGQLQLLEIAIAPARGTVRFAINRTLSVWGSISPTFLERNQSIGAGEVDYVDVEAATFDEILNEYGVPYYLKVDIEGMDMECVLALHRAKERPKFLSIESAVTTGAPNFQQGFHEIAHLWALGYRHFKYVNQARLARGDLNGQMLDTEGLPVYYQHGKDASGPFGEETPNQWLSVEEALARAKRYVLYQNVLGLGGRYAHYRPAKVLDRLRRKILRIQNHSWYDLHAKLGEG